MNTLDHTTAILVAADTPAAVVCQRFAVIGMTCSHCEHAIATEVSRLGGVTAAIANAAAGTLIIEAIRELEVAEVAAAVDDAGYELAR
jgi:copper chaperone